jgi:hypothetical protein
MGGSRRGDHPENIQAVHFWCNGKRVPPGSTRIIISSLLSRAI